MSLLEEIKRVDANSATASGMFFISMLAPGFLTVYLFKQSLFIQLDTVKLIILSLSISSPGVICPFVFSSITAAKLTAKHNINKAILGTPKQWFYGHSFDNALNMYLLLLFAYFFSFNAFEFFISYFSVTLFVTTVSVWSLINKIKDPNKHVFLELP